MWHFGALLCLGSSSRFGSARNDGIHVAIELIAFEGKWKRLIGLFRIAGLMTCKPTTQSLAFRAVRAAGAVVRPANLPT